MNALTLNHISEQIQINPMPKMIIIGDAIEVAKHPEAAVDIFDKYEFAPAKAAAPPANPAVVVEAKPAAPAL